MTKRNSKNGNGQAMERRRDQAMQVRDYLNERIPYLGRLVRNNVKPEALVRFTIVELQAPTKAGEQLRRCSKESIFLSLIAAAQIGLEPSGIRGDAYIVPFKQTATLIPGYRGLVKLARESGRVTKIGAEVVYEHDDFQIFLGTERRVHHQPCLSAPRGEIVGAYAYAEVDGELDVEWMSLEDLERVRQSAQSSNSPAYTDWADQMYRKAPLRRLAKRLPLGREAALATQIDATVEGGDMRAYEKAIRSSVLDVDGSEDLPDLPQDSAGGRFEEAPETEDIDPEGIAAEIAMAETVADVKALAPMISNLPKPARDELMKSYSARLAELKKTEAAA